MLFCKSEVLQDQASRAPYHATKFEHESSGLASPSHLLHSTHDLNNGQANNRVVDSLLHKVIPFGFNSPVGNTTKPQPHTTYHCPARPRGSSHLGTILAHPPKQLPHDRQIMAALVQTYTPQTATVAMLHTRPSSASGMLQSHQGQQYSQSQGGSQQRNSYHGIQGMSGQGGYRGSLGPVQPYAFTSTPNLNQNAQWQHPGSYRASSASAVPTMQSFDHSHNGGRSRYLASASMTNLPLTSTIGMSMGGSRDDSAITGTAIRRATTFTPPHGQPAKPSPERYRRPAPRSTDTSASTQQGHGQQQGPASPSGSGMAGINHSYQQTEQQRRNSFVGAVPGLMAESVQLNGAFSATDAARRLRRRSMPALDSADFIKPLTPLQLQVDLAANKQPEESNRLEQPSSPRPKSAGKERHQKPAFAATIDAAPVQQPQAVHGRTGSSDSRASTRSSNSRQSSVSLPSLLPFLF